MESMSWLSDQRASLEIPAHSLAQAWRSRLIENGVPDYDLVNTVGNIESYAQWCEAWCNTAESRAAEAALAMRNRSGLTAAELWFVAAMEFHFAKHVFVYDEDQRSHAQQRMVECYEKAMPILPWPGSKIDIPFDGIRLPGILRLPNRTTNHRWPIVVLLPGLDATKEELHRFSENFLARGCATLVVDGPGQGEVETQLPIRPDWEVVGSQVYDILGQLTELDSSRAAIVGVSLGGYYAARAISSDPRWRVGASLGGCFSFGEAWDDLPILTRNAFAARSGIKDRELIRSRANSVCLGPAPAVVDGGVFLVVHGSRDPLFADGQAHKMVEYFGRHGQLRLEPDGDHVCHNLAYRVRPEIADWVVEHLKATQ